jgi:hypothetical protein
LPVPEVVIEEVLDELEDTPLTVEAVKARAADALGEEFIQFEPYFDQILELLTAVGTNELTLGEFYEEMTLLEREISSSAFVSDFVRDLLLQTASVARHGLFAALVSETELTSEGAEDGTGSEYFEGLGVLAVYGCVIGGIVGGLPGCVGGAIGAVLLAIDIG